MKKLTVFAALAVMLLGFAGTAQAQHHHGHDGGYRGDYRGDYRGHDYRGHDYRGHRGHGGIVIGGGGIDIIIGGGGRPWHGNRFPDGGYNRGPQTRIVYETVSERVYDNYTGRWIYTGRRYTVSHVARWDYRYRGYVWFDSNGNLRVS